MSVVKVVVYIFGILALTLPSNKVFNFNNEKSLKNFKAFQTAGRGKLAVWKIVKDETAPSGKKCLIVIPDPVKNHGETFNVILYEGLKAKDLEVSVMVKAVKGKEDQGGGIVWRAKDKNNYYVVRWNPLEKNYRLYYVKKGIRRMIATSRVKTNPKKWHRIKVVNIGNRIKCYFDGKLKINIKNSVFKGSGMVGLWSKADASTKFDDLTIKIKSAKRRKGKRAVR